jgi:hypothetical protein
MALSRSADDNSSAISAHNTLLVPEDALTSLPKVPSKGTFETGLKPQQRRAQLSRSISDHGQSHSQLKVCFLW